MIPWPWQVIPRAAQWTIVGASRSGGRSITGAEQVVRSDAGYWRARFLIEFFGEENILAWRAFVASLDGRMGEVEVPTFDLYTRHDINGRRLNFYDAAHLAGASIFDHSGFGQEQLVQATLASSADIRATQITVDAQTSWQAPRPGSHFSIGNRLHRVIGAWRETQSDPWSVRFRPGLRAPAEAGAIVITDRTKCLMRLADDDMADPELDLGYRGEVEVDFVEAI